MNIDYTAILAAAVASWIAGSVWYGVLGKQWMAALGWSREDVGNAMPIVPMITSFVAEIIMALVLLGVLAHMKVSGMQVGLMVAFLIWLGFVATTIVVNNAFSKRTFMLSLIDSGHWLLVLLVQALVLGWMR
jgi:hypothetical protein